jgi:hypothetical protein
VVERTNAWLKGLKRMRIRWDRLPEILHFLRKPKSDPAKFGAPLEKKRPFCQAEVMNNNFVLNRRAFHENSIFTPNLAGLDR